MTAVDASIEGTGVLKDPAWRWGDLARFVVVRIALVLALSLLLRAVERVSGLDVFDSAYWPASRGPLVGQALLHATPLLAVWLLFTRAGATRRRPLGLRRPSGALALTVAAGATGLLVGAKVMMALIALEHPALIPPQLAGQQFGAPSAEVYSGWGLVLTLLTAGVIAALAEELVYRGVIFGCLRQRLGIRLALPLSAAVFAVVHPPAAMPFAFAAGLLLAWLYHRSRSLWPGIVVHGLNNITTMLVLAAVARS